MINNELILKLLNNGMSLESMASILSVTNDNLYFYLNELKDNGYEIIRKYYDDGSVVYQLLDKKIKEDDLDNNVVEINMPDFKNSFKIIVTADLHLGHIKDNLEYSYQLTNYAIKNNIHNFFIVGDFIHGMSKLLETKHNTLDEQLEYALTSYPYDESIRNYILFGNHEYHCIYYNKKDITNMFLKKREDFVVLGYGRGYIKIYNNIIGLKHNLSIIKTPLPMDCKKVMFTLVGHSHSLKINKNKVNPQINLPTLSNFYPTRPAISGALELELFFSHNELCSGKVKLLSLEPNIEVVNEYSLNSIMRK